ncbi:MAG: hypothetical protein L3J56_03700 [Bacteroidales bacterium]|nr:hypothetical protein [Bacteroidales bacterium]
MIQITHPNISDFVKEHYNAIIEYFERKTTTTGFSKKDLDNINKWLKINFEINFEYVIKANPRQLKKLIKKKTTNSNSPDYIKKILKLYNGFANSTKKFMNGYNATELVDKLGITVCPYCNREYIFKFEDTEKGKARVLATFDHFYDKGRYPFLALSFYNLIPSCSICNSKFKHTKDFAKEEHLHPYEDDFNSLAKFHLKITKPSFYYSKDVIDIELKGKNKNDTKTKNTITTFRLNEIYKEHSDIALELIKKQYMYSEEYIETLFKQYEGTLFKNYEQLKGIIFGNYISDDEIHKRPLAKFTKDIVKDLE